MIVAFYAYAPESGKDAAGLAAVEWAQMENRTWSKRGFADPLKVVCADALGIPGTDEYKIAEMDRIKLNHGVVSYSRENPDKGLERGDPGFVSYSTGQTGRDFIIGLAGDSSGEFGIRRFDMGFWVRLALTYETECLFITDLRFQVEADAVREGNGVVVEIERPGTTHKNEDRIEPDYRILNDGTLEAFQLDVCRVLDEIFPP